MTGDYVTEKSSDIHLSSRLLVPVVVTQLDAQQKSLFVQKADAWNLVLLLARISAIGCGEIENIDLADLSFGNYWFDWLEVEGECSL